MKFHFINIDETADYLNKNAAQFRSSYPSVEEGVAFIKQQAVSIFSQSCQDAKCAQDVNDGILQVPVWRNVGATFAALGGPNHSRGDDFAIAQDLPDTSHIEVNLWISLPLE